MEKFIYTNPAGKSITFDYSGEYLIESYDGLTSAELEPITIKGYSQNGYKLGNMLFGARYITIYFDMIGKTAEDIYMKRADLGSILNPILGEGILTYTNDSVSRSIRCIPVTIYLPHVRGSQPQTRDNSLPKLYNGRAMVWRVSPRAFRSYGSQPAGLP